MSPLKVYKASAGSGKTFALTLEYLELLFRFPDAHRHILAVTFTNKAAGEMKDRILSRLHSLSRIAPGERNEDLELLAGKTGLKEDEIRARAGKLLNAILNDYSGFSVGTIDRFFQSVIRAFTREIGIQPGYNLELDHQRVLSMGVDRLFQDIGVDRELRSWLIRFAEERLEESRSWNFRGDILQLGLQLFRESFQELFAAAGPSIMDRPNLDRYLGDLQDGEKHAREEIRQLGREALEGISGAGFGVEDFRLKSKSPAAAFRQAAEEGEVRFTDGRLQAMEQAGKWLTKDAPVPLAGLVEAGLMPLLRKLYAQQVILNTVRAIRQHFYTLGILGDLRQRVQEYLKEHNLFLIADSSRFLHGIINGNQVPFIYEKTGNRYGHIMLDEFQDTSVFQYENFASLLDNALARGNDCLVVGDVKQSIYRWRNSDWKILASDLEKDFSHQQRVVRSLEHNYRSREQIIRFNNTVFQLAPEVLAGKIAEETDEEGLALFRDAYADAVQQFPEKDPKPGGLVRMEFLNGEGEGDFREQALGRIPEWIREITDAGIAPGDTAILVRSRREGVMVAEKLLEHARETGEPGKYRLVSSESLLLANNDAVSLLISALRFLLDPGDEQNNALLKYRLACLVPRDGADLEQLFADSTPPGAYLPAGFMDRIRLYRQMPLLELVESLIAAFGLHRRVEDLPYLQALQDLLIELGRREMPGIDGFLEYWEQQGWKMGIQASESSRAIRILTIHRAKGLEFRAVIIPFCNWEMTTDQRKANILWCDTGATPFRRLPLVPVRYSGTMKHTLFSEFYYRERMKGYLDNLNLLYVAFTRAVDMLFIGVPESKGGEPRHVGELLGGLLDGEPRLSPALGPLSSFKKGKGILIGEMPVSVREPVKEDEWSFRSYPVPPAKRLLRLRMRNEDYFVDEEGLFRSGRAFGNLMHIVFSRIRTAADVDPVLDAMQREGVIPAGERPELREQILALIGTPEVQPWFTGAEGRVIMNERSILSGSGKVIRPDRVIVDPDRVTVVDLKFGRIEKEVYRNQVRHYMDHLVQMGYPNVKGYLWYAMLGKTVQIGKT